MSPARGVADPVRVTDRVRELLGPEGAGPRPGTRLGPETGPVARPGSHEEVADLLRVAGEEGWRVWPQGGGLARAFGPGAGAGRRGTPGLYTGVKRPEPESAGAGGPDLVISTLAMDGILEHEPADLVVRVRAGTRLESLQAEVGSHNQWLALDPPGGAAVTVGGVASEGTAGPLRVRYGRPRDQVLGLTLVDGSGRVLVLGGRVVKNVAGFDLVRLAAGSRGTLGVITEVVFRLHPVPEVDRTLIWSRDTPGEAWTLGRALATLPLPFAATELIGGAWASPLEDPGFRVLIRLQGSEGAVAELADRLREVGGPPRRALEGEASRAAAHALSEGNGASPDSVRIHTLPDRMGPLLPEGDDEGWERFSVHLLHGVLRGVGRGEVGATVGAGPGLPPGVRALESRIRAAFDPSGVLPGTWWKGAR